MKNMSDIEYGCYIDWAPGEKPDEICVLDEYRAEDCIEAMRLLEENKTKWDCPYWRSTENNSEVSQWKPIKTAPKDGTVILAYCVHSADPYWDEDGGPTTYGWNCEDYSGHVEDGFHLIEWGEEYIETDEYGTVTATTPAWWYLAGSDPYIPANPTHWMPLPEPPEKDA